MHTPWRSNKNVCSHHGFGWDLWSAVCMNRNIIALSLVDFVRNTNRETIYFIYTQNLPRNHGVNDLQNPKTDFTMKLVFTNGY